MEHTDYMKYMEVDAIVETMVNAIVSDPSEMMELIEENNSNQGE